MTLVYHRTFEGEISGKYAKVAARLPPKSSILEVGCHTGYFSRVLIELGHKVLGIERDEEAALTARRQGVPVLLGDIEDPAILSRIPDTFDVVLLMDVLEHLREPAVVLARLKTLLNPQGRLIVTGPNVAYWAVRKDLLLGRWNYTEAGILDRTHLHFYTAVGWRSLIEGAGYRIVTLEPAEGMIPWEHIINKIPFFGRMTPHLKEWALRWMPELFAIVFLVEARPNRL